MRNKTWEYLNFRVCWKSLCSLPPPLSIAIGTHLNSDLGKGNYLKTFRRTHLCLYICVVLTCPTLVYRQDSLLYIEDETKIIGCEQVLFIWQVISKDFGQLMVTQHLVISSVGQSCERDKKCRDWRQESMVTCLPILEKTVELIKGLGRWTRICSLIHSSIAISRWRATCDMGGVKILRIIVKMKKMDSNISSKEG